MSFFASFVKKDHSFNRLRELKNDPWGYGRKVWKKMAELGWMGLIYPEEYGALGLDFAFVMVLLEEFGKGLLPEPYLSTWGGSSEIQRTIIATRILNLPRK